MAKFWYNLVVNNIKTIDEVPERWREIVERMLEENK